MTVYEFLKQAARSHSAVVDGGKTEDIYCDLSEHSVWSGMKPIVLGGEIIAPCVILENGDTFALDGLINLEGDLYADL